MSRGRKNRRRVDQAALRAAFASFARQALKAAAGLLLLAGAAYLAVAGAGKVRAFLLTSPVFSIASIELEGLERASDVELLRLGEIAPGDNIFLADTLAAERAMAAHPWVKRVAIDRIYPRTLKVRVTEHVPAALAELGGLYYVDAQGQAFKKLMPGEPVDLVVLTGVDREAYAAAPEEAEALFREALQALRAFEEAGLGDAARVSEIRVDPNEGLTVFCGEEALQVVLGRGDYPSKLQRLSVVLSELSRRSRRAQVVRLDNRARPDWVAVQVAGEAAPR